MKLEMAPVKYFTGLIRKSGNTVDFFSSDPQFQNFRSHKFEEYPPGSLVACHFGISSTRRRLVKISLVKNLHIKITPKVKISNRIIERIIRMLKSNGHLPSDSEESMREMLEYGMEVIFSYFPAASEMDNPTSFSLKVENQIGTTAEVDWMPGDYKTDEESFLIRAISVDHNKINAIKGVRKALGFGLKEAKELVESIPADLAKVPTNEEARAIKRELASHGVIVQIKTVGAFEFEEVTEQEQVEEEESLAPISEWIENHWFDPEARIAFAGAMELVKDGGSVNIVMRGPSGYGKTSAFEAIASEMDMKYVRINCAVMTDTEQWFGYQEARNGETVFIPSNFTKALTEGNAVIVLDEGNRIEPWLWGSLFPILDHEKKTSVHMMDIEVGDNIIIGMTINEGSKFAGTFSIDAALMNRFDISLIVQPLPSEVERDILVKEYDISSSDAEKIVSVIHSIREQIVNDDIDVDASTRTSLKIARLVKTGMNMKQAFTFTISNFAGQDEVRGIIDQINLSL